MIMIVLGGCLCTLSAVAQSLSGKIQDKEKASLAYVTVSAKNQSDTTQIFGGISDDKGKFPEIIANDLHNCAHRKKTFYLTMFFLIHRINNSS